MHVTLPANVSCLLVRQKHIRHAHDECWWRSSVEIITFHTFMTYCRHADVKHHKHWFSAWADIFCKLTIKAINSSPWVFITPRTFLLSRSQIGQFLESIFAKSLFPTPLEFDELSRSLWWCFTIVDEFWSSSVDWWMSNRLDDVANLKKLRMIKLFVWLLWFVLWDQNLYFGLRNLWFMSTLCYG